MSRRDGIDTSELKALSADLGKISGATTKAMYGVFKEGAEDLRDQWRENARETSGAHGRHYPKSITYDVNPGLNIEFEVGPDPRLKQGSMGPGFEYGSVNQPPHLDGQRAADQVVPKIAQRVDSAMAYLLRGF